METPAHLGLIVLAISAIRNMLTILYRELIRSARTGNEFNAIYIKMPKANILMSIGKYLLFLATESEKYNK